VGDATSLFGTEAGWLEERSGEKGDAVTLSSVRSAVQSTEVTMGSVAVSVAGSAVVNMVLVVVEAETIEETSLAAGMVGVEVREVVLGAVVEAVETMVVVTAAWTGRWTVDGLRKIPSVDGVWIWIAGSGLDVDASGWGEWIRITGDGAVSMMLEKSVLWGGGERGDGDAE